MGHECYLSLVCLSPIARILLSIVLNKKQTKYSFMDSVKLSLTIVIIGFLNHAIMIDIGDAIYVFCMSLGIFYEI